MSYYGLVLSNYAAALAPVIWGTTYLTTTEFLPPDRPFTAAVLRALPAGVVLLAMTRQRPHGIWWLRSLVLGTLNIGAFFALLFVAAYRLPGGLAAALGAVQPLFVMGFAWAVAGDRPTAQQVLAAAVGACGVAMLVLRPGARVDLVGLAAALGAALSMAAGIVLGRKWGRPAGLLAVTGWQLIAGGAVLAPLALAVEGVPEHVSGRNLVGYGYLTTVGTAVAYILWFRGVQTLPSVRLSMFGLLSPLVAASLGWIVLGQQLGPVQIAGFALVLGSVLIAQLRGPRPANGPRRQLPTVITPARSDEASYP